MSNFSPQVEIAAPVASPSVKADHHITAAAKGGGILLGGKFFAYGARFVIGILLARFLAAEQYGLYNLSFAAVEIAAGLAACGLGAALVRYIPIYRSRQDESRLWGTIQIGLILPALVSLFLSIALYILAIPIAEQWFEEPKLAPLLQLVSPAIVFFTLVDMLAAATRGFKEMRYTVIAQDVVLSVVKLFLLLAMVLIGLTAARAVTATSLTEMIVCGLLFFFLNKQFPLRRPLATGQREIGEIVKFSSPMYLADIIIKFSGNIKALLLGTLHNVASVGVFSVASQVTMISDMFHSSIVTVSQPIISEISSRGDRNQLKNFYQTVSRWSLTLNFPLFLALLLFPGPIISIFGETFTNGIVVLKILAWTGLVNTGTGICGVLIDMSGNTRLKLVNTIISVTVSISLSFLMIPTWGLIGAAIASLTSAIIINLLRLIEVFILFRLLPYNAIFLKPLIAGGIAFSLMWIASWFYPTVDLLHLIVSLPLLVAIYVGLLLLLGLSEEDRLIVQRLRRRVENMLSR